jgi:hypothetical protein
MPFTTYLDRSLLQHAFGGPQWTPPATIYVGLSSSAPTPQSTSGWNFTEPPAATNGYARPGLAYNTTNFVPVGSEPLAGYDIAVGVLVAFPQSTGPWLAGTLLGWFGLFDAATGGNLLAFGPANPPLSVVGPGYLPEFPAMQLVTSLT